MKRFILALVLALIPVTVFAEDYKSITVEDTVIYYPENVPESMERGVTKEAAIRYLMDYLENTGNLGNVYGTGLLSMDEVREVFGWGVFGYVLNFPVVCSRTVNSNMFYTFVKIRETQEVAYVAVMVK